MKPLPESSSTAGAKPSCALLDTTVQMDRCKTESRKQTLESILAKFDWRFSTGISLVEFKATLIQECITIHNQLRRPAARFTRVRDALLEKMGQQISLRAHIFNNIIQVSASSFDITEERDLLLAEKARLLLENIIPYLYEWFAKESVDVVLNDRIACDRAKEPPKKKTAAFETNLPDCKRGKNKHCRVEEVIREAGTELVTLLLPYLPVKERELLPANKDEKLSQLRKTVDIFNKVLGDPKAELSHGDCRNAGDCLINLEAKGKATHALSSNAKEWESLSKIFGITFVRIAYPEEKTS